MSRRIRDSLELVALVLALVALAIAITILIAPVAPPQTTSDPAGVLDTAAQQKVTEQAALAPNPTCNPPTGAVMGTCAPKQALALAKALAPQGDTPPSGHGHGGSIAALLGSLIGVDTAYAASGSALRGPDTSHYNFCAPKDPRRSAPGAQFWIVAAGDGYYTDPCYLAVYRALRAERIPRALYLYTRGQYSPTAEADHFRDLIRAAGGPDSIPPIDDAEAVTSCQWVRAFDGRLKSDLHLAWIYDYASPGTWANCAAGGNHDWSAAYGPFPPTLFGFSTWDFWQHTDGRYGVGPFCNGSVCGDQNVFHFDGAQLNLIANVKPPPPPIAPRFAKACSQLDAITYWKRTGGHGHVSASQHRQAVADRALLARGEKTGRVGCTRPPHAVPYRYPRRPGALA